MSGKEAKHQSLESHHKDGEQPRPSMSSSKDPIPDLTQGEKNALEMQLQRLVPILKTSIREDEPDILDEDLQILLDAQLSRARINIPLRWHQEKLFKAGRQEAQQLLVTLRNNLQVLRGKTISDNSLKHHSEKAFSDLQKWDTHQRVELRAILDNAKSYWYKPTDDPLITAFGSLALSFNDLRADLMFEVSKSPLLKAALGPRTPRGQEESQEVKAKIPKLASKEREGPDYDNIPKKTKVKDHNVSGKMKSDACLSEVKLTNKSVHVPKVKETNKQNAHSFALNQSSVNATEFKGFSGTTMCYLMNPDTLQMVKVRALHDSGANSALVSKDTARKANLSGPKTKLMMNTAGANQVV